MFTNGTFIDERYFKLLDECRNLVPVLSIEGGREITDARRGEGIYDRVTGNMKKFREKGLIFGASITVTTENVQEVTSEAFVRGLAEQGCKLIIYVEFVPVTEEATHLAPGEKERAYMAEAVDAGKRVLPHQLSRRRRAVSLLPVFGHQREDDLSPGCDEISAV